MTGANLQHAIGGGVVGGLRVSPGFLRFVLFLPLLFTGHLSAQASGSPRGFASRITVGGDHNYPPFEYLDEDGAPAGFNVDLTRAIAAETDLEIDIQLRSWTETIGGLAEGEIDAVQGMFYSPQRDRMFAFSPPYIVVHCVAVVRRGEGSPPATLEELSGRRIVVQRGDIMHDFAAEHDLGEYLTAVDSQEEALRQVVSGDHDCALVARMTAFFLMDRHDWSELVVGETPFLSPEYCYAVPETNQALLAELSEGLKGIEQSGEYRRIYARWLGVYSPHGLSTRTVLKVIAVVGGPLLAVALFAIAWSWSLRGQVARRTAQLRRSSEFQRAMIACSPVALYSVDLAGTVLTWNRSAERLFGWTADEIIGKPLPIVPEEKQREFAALREQALREEMFVGKELVRQRKGGSRIHISLSVAAIHDESGKVVGIMGAAEDIRARVEAEKRLRASEKRFRSLVENAPEAIFIETAGRFAYLNDAALELFGAECIEQLRNQPVADRFHPSVRERAQERIRLLNEEKQAVPMREEIYVRLDGSDVPVEVAAVPTSYRGLDGAVVFVRNILSRKQYEDRIEHLNRVLRAIRDITQLIVREEDPHRLIQNACNLLVEHRSYRAACIALTDDDDLVTHYAQAGMDSLFAALQNQDEMPCAPPCCARARKRGTVVLVTSPDGLCGDCGIRTHCRERDVMCVALNQAGNHFGYLAVRGGVETGGDAEERDLFVEVAGDLAYAVHNLSLQKARQEAERGREAAQQQLLRARKMESIGRLAGGVAHDFNNLLMGIMNYVDLCRDHLDSQHPVQQWLGEISRDAERSANLTRQLLAFASKQTIAPRILDINQELESMHSMLKRLIGEDIDLAWTPTGNLWQVKMDPGQIDQLLVNLCVNARDAIDGVGSITISTENVTIGEDDASSHLEATPGEWVLLTVRDDGCGMNPDTLEHIFEPFFTTKSTGHGTGLGLATVHGIARQNGGFIDVTSEPGKGTTFKIHLPRYQGRSEPEDAVKPPQQLQRGSETVLLVEDEKSVRLTTQLFLQKAGYTVLMAETPQEALRQAEDHEGEIDLLVTDVVMPEMSGRELAEKLTTLFPTLKCLFISGYTADVIAHQGVLDDNVQFLSKPFSKEDITRTVRQVLDNGAVRNEESQLSPERRS